MVHRATDSYNRPFLGLELSRSVHIVKVRVEYIIGFQLNYSVLQESHCTA